MDKFILPSGFSQVKYADGSNYTCELINELNEDDAEVWLIRAPLGADLRALNGQKCRFGKRRLSKCENGTSNTFEISHHSSFPGELEGSLLMIPDFNLGELKPCNAKISGFLSISNAVTLPETSSPSVVETEETFLTNLRLHHLPIGAEDPAEPVCLKSKKRKRSVVSDDEIPEKKKSKKNKHKEHLAEDSLGSNQVTEELPDRGKKKIKKHWESSGEDSHELLQIANDMMSSTSKKHKRQKANSEECNSAVKIAKRSKIGSNCDSSSDEDSKSVICITNEKLSPVRKTKKAKKEDSLTEDFHDEVMQESPPRKKKSTGNKHSKDFDNNVIENSSQNYGSDANISVESDANVVGKKKNKKHKKHKKERLKMEFHNY